MIGRRGSAVRLASALLVAMLVAAGCTGGGGEQEGAPAQGGVVKVGILVPLTGELGSFGGPWRQAVELAVKEINEAGGLPGGATIETVVDDEKTDPEAGVQAARRMIEVEGVVAIVGPTSAVMVALVPLAKRAQVPVISAAAGTVALNELGGDFIYRTVASDNSDGFAIARFLSDQGATDVALLVQNEESTLSPAETFRQAFEEAGGRVIASVTYNPGQTSYRAELERVLGADPGWIVCACGQQSGVTLIKEAAAAGYDGKWLVTADIVTPEAIKAVGPDIMEGVYGEVATSDTSLPAYKDFASKYEAEYGEDVYPFTPNAYDAMVLIALAMVKAGATDGAAINSALREVANPPGTEVSSFEEGVAALRAGEDINYEGASGPVDLDASGTATSPYSIQQVKNGEWVEVEFLPADLFTQPA